MRECGFDSYAHALNQSLMADRVLLAIARSRRLGTVEEPDAQALLRGRKFFGQLVKSAESGYFTEDSQVPIQDLDLIIEASGKCFSNKGDFVSYLTGLQEEAEKVFIGGPSLGGTETVESFLAGYQRLQSIRFYELDGKLSF